jgi:hypothetical protein
MGHQGEESGILQGPQGQAYWLEGMTGSSFSYDRCPMDFAKWLVEIATASHFTTSQHRVHSTYGSQQNSFPEQGSSILIRTGARRGI